MVYQKLTVVADMEIIARAQTILGGEVVIQFQILRNAALMLMQARRDTRRRCMQGKLSKERSSLGGYPQRKMLFALTAESQLIVTIIIMVTISH